MLFILDNIHYIVEKVSKERWWQVMNIMERFFKLDTEWNVLHLPPKPNGFAVFIIGDRSDFVDEDSSFWHQNYGRYQLVQQLLNQGYTLYHSNLFGNNWGSPRALTMAMQLYHVVMKKEILNPKIHLLVDGMGGLTAIQMMQKMSDKIRSVAMLNPCLDLKAHLENEKEHKFFYKRLKREIGEAYEVDSKKIASLTLPGIDECIDDLPVRIWQRMNKSNYPSRSHGKKYEEIRERMGKPIQFNYHLGENPYRVNQSIIKFFKENEKVL